MKLRRPAARALASMLGIGAFAVLGVSPALADDNQITAGHVDIVEIDCDPGAGGVAQLEVGSHIDDNPFGSDHVDPGDIGDYSFNWTYDNGDLVGYGSNAYAIDVPEARLSEQPYVGFAYDEENHCAGISAPNLTVQLTKVSGSGNSTSTVSFAGAGSHNLVAGGTAMTLAQHDHIHGAWTVGASSETGVSDVLQFVVKNGATTIGTVQTTFVVHS